MWRLGIAVIVVVYVIGLCGCGGGSGGGSSSSVSIQSFSVFNHPAERRTRFVAKTISIVSGTDAGVTWVNQDTLPHRIVSGIVVADGNPANVYQIVVNLGFFTPDNVTAHAGDTIRFNNLSGRQFRLEIVNDNGTVISTVILNQGEMRDIPFPGPGVFIVRDSDQQQVATVTLLGAPVPDGQFDSGVLTSGQTFTRVFTVPKNYPYYDANPSDPTTVYATGTVVAQ